jgi:hypothetical protein
LFKKFIGTNSMTEILKEVESRSDIDSGEIDRHRLSLSRGLYLGAWGIEIIAVITGLAISVMVGITAFTDATEVRGEATNSDYINTLIAVLPFVLVALSELTKIPIAGAAYYARSKPWKYLLSFSWL